MIRLRGWLSLQQTVFHNIHCDSCCPQLIRPRIKLWLHIVHIVECSYTLNVSLVKYSLWLNHLIKHGNKPQVAVHVFNIDSQFPFSKKSFYLKWLKLVLTLLSPNFGFHVIFLLFQCGLSPQCQWLTAAGSLDPDLNSQKL